MTSLPTVTWPIMLLGAVPVPGPGVVPGFGVLLAPGFGVGVEPAGGGSTMASSGATEMFDPSLNDTQPESSGAVDTWKVPAEVKPRRIGTGAVHAVPASERA